MFRNELRISGKYINLIYTIYSMILIMILIIIKKMLIELSGVQFGLREIICVISKLNERKAPFIVTHLLVIYFRL